MHLLKKIAIYGGVVALGGAVLSSLGIQVNFKRQEYYKQSMELLHGYPPALRLLGEPIRAKHIDLGDVDKTRTDGLSAKLAIPIKGQKQRGVLYSWASRSGPTESWNIDRLDIEVNKKCWTFYINPNSKIKEELAQNAALTDIEAGQLLAAGKVPEPPELFYTQMNNNKP